MANRGRLLWNNFVCNYLTVTRTSVLVSVRPPDPRNVLFQLTRIPKLGFKTHVYKPVGLSTMNSSKPHLFFLYIPFTIKVYKRYAVCDCSR